MESIKVVFEKKKCDIKCTFLLISRRRKVNEVCVYVCVEIIKAAVETEMFASNE